MKEITSLNTSRTSFTGLHRKNSMPQVYFSKDQHNKRASDVLYSVKQVERQLQENRLVLFAEQMC